MPCDVKAVCLPLFQMFLLSIHNQSPASYSDGRWDNHREDTQQVRRGLAVFTGQNDAAPKLSSEAPFPFCVKRPLNVIIINSYEDMLF